MRAPAARSTGSPARPVRRRFPTTIARSTSSRACARAGAPRTRSESRRAARCVPYKWYVAAYRTDPSQARWTKVIARAHRAQLDRRLRPHPRRRRPRPQSRRGDRAADRRRAMRASLAGDGDEPRRRRTRGSPVDGVMRRWCGRSTAVRELPRGHGGHAASRDRAGRRRVARRWWRSTCRCRRSSRASTPATRIQPAWGQFLAARHVALRPARAAARAASRRARARWPRW